MYTTIKADERFLCYALCSVKDCSTYTLRLWDVASSIPSNTIEYITRNSEISSYIVPSESESFEYKVTRYNSTTIDSLEIPQNYGFSPILYVDRDNTNHLLYFSGGGNIVKGICGDSLLRDIIIDELIPNKSGKPHQTLYKEFLLTGERTRPLLDYAAILLTFNESSLYLIHGGISCDRKTIYSDIIVMDVLTEKYVKSIQENGIQR